jgi:hypothetical protein
LIKKKLRMKILIQNLEDQEATFRKETIRTFEQPKQSPMQSTESLVSKSNSSTFKNELLSLTRNTYLATKSTLSSIKKSSIETNSSNSSKMVNFLLYSNKSSIIQDFNEINNNKDSANSSKLNLVNFKRVFNTISKLNKSVNIFNGNNLDIDSNHVDQFNSFFNFHASINDLNALIHNYKAYVENNSAKTNMKSVDAKFKSSTISLCSNMMENSPPSHSKARNLKPFGYQNHSTMLFEHNGVKIGFMALYDRSVFDKLASAINSKIEYFDFVSEADRLSRQLRQSGASLVLALVNMENESEMRLLSEASDLDIIFCSGNNSSEEISCRSISGMNRKTWLVKGSNDFNNLCLIKLKMCEAKLDDVSIVKYYIE